MNHAAKLPTPEPDWAHRSGIRLIQKPKPYPETLVLLLGVVLIGALGWFLYGTTHGPSDLGLGIPPEVVAR
jgi:hypothetical protein